MDSPGTSYGRGNVFIVVPRAWLDGKYIRWRWEGYISAMFIRAQIYDGEYDRSSDTDFPTYSFPLSKGAGLLQTLASKTDTFGPETQDKLVDVSAGTEEKCTIFFYINDGDPYKTPWMEIDWVEFNTGAGGAGTLFDEQFTDSVHMERTGTYGDYGYISTGEVIVPVERFQEEGADFKETKFGAMWE